jgi:hypothetical protein
MPCDFGELSRTEQNVPVPFAERPPPRKRNAMIAKNSHISTWTADEKRTVALATLLDAHQYAADLQRPIWDFAVEWPQLAAAGLTSNDLRWLLAKGHVELANEIGKCKLSGVRRFRPAPAGAVTRRTCVVMTAAGVAFAAENRRGLSEFCECGRAKWDRPLCPDGSRIGTNFENRNGAIENDKRPLPVLHWDSVTRQLWFGKDLIKQFKVPAKNQELVLAAFAEEGWPPCIDDPLPPQDGIDAKTRLHDTINRLNRSHKHQRIRFHGNGNGLAVHWAIVSPTRNIATKSTPKRR